MNDSVNSHNQKKIGILIPANLRMAPYIKYYTSILDALKIGYVTVGWDRFGWEENVEYVLKHRTENSDRKRVFLGQVKYAHLCKKVIKKEKIDKLIIFTMAPAFFLGNRYLRRFKNNYIIDVRDDSPFRKVFPRVLEGITNQAYGITISSPYYNTWFSRDTVLCHNVDMRLLSTNEETHTEILKKRVIRLVFAGSMIEPDVNIKIIDQLANDNRFKLIFIGRENAARKQIEQHVISENIKNVFFEGVYNKEDIVDIYRQKADLVNIFRKESDVNKEALPNKLYDAVIAGVPIVTFKHNYAITEYVQKYSLGIIIDENYEGIGDNIYKEINEFNYETYAEGRLKFLEAVRKDM